MDIKSTEFLKALYMQQSKGMFRYAYSILKDEYLAEDAVQETFTAACKNIETLKTNTSPVGWLFEALKRIMKRLRSEEFKLRKHILTLDKSQSDTPAAPDDINPVILFDGVIPRGELDLLNKIYVHGYTYKDLADEMGVPLSNIAMKAKRAKEKFRHNYKE